VPYLKFSRDKRGYEHFSIIEPGTPRRGRPQRPRLLFWFRTPPQVKVGRLPFTDDVRRAIESQNPGVRFDWPRLLATPIPPPDAEHWRERRRIEKAAKQAAKEAEGSEASEGVPEVQNVREDRDAHDDHEAVDDHEAGQEQELEAGQEHEASQELGSHDLEAGEGASVQAETPVQASDSTELVTAAPTAATAERPAGGRRRRRRGRRRPRPAGETTAAEPALTVPVPPTEEV
jgi:hypothetical protein